MEYPFRKEQNYDSEYGNFKIVIRVPGFRDYEELYTINDDNPVHYIHYKPVERAGVLVLNNHFAQNWNVIVENEEGIMYYSNEKRINLIPGVNKIIISLNGFLMEKEVEVTAGETYNLDFEGELKKRKENI